MIKAVIFDLDGLLIDSEPYWRRVEIEMLQKFGINATDEMVRETYGLRTDEVIAYWYDLQPWPNPDHKKMEADFYVLIQELINGADILMEGAKDAINIVKTGGFLSAIASSSPRIMIENFVSHYNLSDSFDLIHSSVEEAFGKPHPAVYLSTAAKLGVPPTSCLAIEDSVHGVVAAKAARMKTIVIPEPVNYDDQRYNVADGKLRSLKELTLSMIQALG
jgi:sugar-phosphatase